jgi:predicted nucleic acid-binding Zn ribbon protein
MRRSYTARIGDLLDDFIRVHGFETKLREAEAISYWEELMKPAFLGYCRDVRIQNGILYVTINSSVVRAELGMMREEIRNKINDQAGFEIIRKIVFR